MFALLASSTHRVYRYLEHLTLNFVLVPVFLIFTDRASLRRAVRRKSLISLICLGCCSGAQRAWGDGGQGLDAAAAARRRGRVHEKRARGPEKNEKTTDAQTPSFEGWCRARDGRGRGIVTA